MGGEESPALTFFAVLSPSATLFGLQKRFPPVLDCEINKHG